MNAVLVHLLEGAAMFAIMVGLTIISRKVIKRVPVLAESRRHNLAEDRIRMAQDKYPSAVRKNSRTGFYILLFLILVIAPFYTSFEALPWWRYVTDGALIILLYDLFYYFTHRFLFHGNAYFKRVHGLHHQARNPSHIDSQYVHPLETFIGLLLFIVTFVMVGSAMESLNVVAMGVLFFIYGQLNILNHAQVDIDDWRFHWASWMSKKHHAHHVNMNAGNYSTIVLFYDKLFGTLE